VSWWRGEGNATDTISTNHGTLSGGASFASGEVGQGFSFDGTGEVAAPGTPSLNVTTFTLEAWVNPSVLDGNMEIILNKENSPAFNESDVSYELAIRGTADPGAGSIPVGQLAFFVGGINGLPGEYGSWVGGGSTIPTNQWSHCALTFDGRNMVVYINGSRTRTFDGASGAVIATTGPFKIGSRSPLQVSASPASRFNGLIDEVGVYSRALSAEEIQAIYNASGAGKCLPTNCAIPPVGLVSWWKGDGNALDQVGGNNGTLVGNTTFAPGKVGQGFVFDGLGSYVSAGSSESLRFSNQLSISSWIFPTGAGQHPVYGGIIVNREGEYELARFADGTIGWAFANQGGIWTWLSSGASAPLNQWTHVALTFDNGFVSAFVNGQLVQSNSGNPALGDIYPGSNEFRIGNRQEDGQGFGGVIDEVAVFNRALSTNEVAAIYVAGNAGICTVPMPLSITSFTPLAASVSARIDISGTGFDPVASNNIVYFGPVQAAIASASSTTLQVIVPLGTTFNAITLTAGGRTAYSQRMFVPTFDGASVLSASSFATKVDFPAGNLPADLAIGDFDGDGKPDIVVVNHNDNTFSVYRNITIPGAISSGSLATPVNFTTGQNPIAVAVGDLDGDGKLDLAIANHFGDSISIYRNTSVRGVIDADSFAAPLILPASVGPHGLAIQDMNGDGKPDLIVPNNGHGSGNTVSVYRNTGTPGNLAFAERVSYIVGTEPDFLTVGDLDGDGKPDIAVMNFVSSTLALLRNTSTDGVIDGSSFQTKVEFSTPTEPDQTIRLGDLDGDGKLDIAVGVDQGGAATVFRNTTSPGGFTTSSLAPRLDFTQDTLQAYVSLGDVNGDSKPDLVIFHSGIISVFLNTSSPGSLGPGSFAPKVDFQTEAGWNLSRVLIADLDADGRPELIALNQQPGNNKLSILKNNVAHGCVPVPSGLVSSWRGENSTADTTSGNSGIVAGSGTVAYGLGVVGQAFVFDGTHRDRVDVGNPANLQLEDFTIEAWVKRSSPTVTSFDVLGADGSIAGDGACIFGYGRGGYIFALANDGRMILSRTDLDGLFSTPLVTDTNWHHLAVTKSGTSAVFYMDGVPQATPAYVHPAPYTFDDATCACVAAAAIGSRGDGRGGTFFGMIDEVSIYNRGLSAIEIQGIYDAGSAGKCLPPCVPSPTGLVSWWQAENGAQDIVDGNNGTLVDGASYAPGKVGQAFSFDGVDDFVLVEDAPNLRFGPTSPMTVEMWVFRTSSKHVQHMIGKRADCTSSPTEGTFQLALNTDTGAGLAFGPPSGSCACSGQDLPLNTWTHLAGTFDGTSLRLYVNGVVVATTPGLLGPANTAPLKIGDSGTCGAAYGGSFGGLIDEVSIYNRALTTNEVAAIYSAGAAGMCPLSSTTNCSPAASGLVGWWKADSNAGDVVSGNTGVLQNVGYTNGVVGQAFSFDPSSFPSGTYNGVQIPDQPAYALTNSLTIEGWVRPRGDGYVIFWRGDNRTGLDPYALSMQANYTLLFQISAENGNSASVGASLPYNLWTHVAGTLDGSSGMMSIYTNGALASQTTTAIRPFGDLIASDFPGVGIGNVNDGRNNFAFNGDIDEISLYNRALLPGEIQAIYNGGSAGKCAPTSPPEPVLAVITSQPTNLTVYAGSNATFRVTATGTAPLSYQWRFDTNDLPGATSSTLSLIKVQLSNAGPYSVVISNAAGSVTSSIATLTVNPLPNCTPPPAGLVSWWRAENDSTDSWDSNNATLSKFSPGKVGLAFNNPVITVPDSASLHFSNTISIEAWVNPSTSFGSPVHTILSKFDFPSRLSSGTNSSFLFGTTNNGLPFFLVSPKGSALSNATVIVNNPLPVNQWSFLVATYDGSALRFYVNGALAAQTDYTGGIFAGTSPLGIGSLQSGLGQTFSGLIDEVSLYNRALTDEEIHSIFSSDVIGKCLVAPNISTQPRDQSVPLGEDAKFTVSVLGSRPLKYQWRFNGVKIANATNPALVLEKLKSNSIGSYSVLVSNAVGFATSSNATLALLPAPTCTDTPAGLISWWPADGNLADTMGTNNISTFLPTLYATGKVDRAFSFNGISSRLQIPSSTSLSFGSNADFSIEMWVKAGASNTFNANVPLLEKHGPGTSWIGYSLSLNQGRLAFAIGSAPISAANVSTFISPGPDLRDTMFHHVAASITRASTTGGRLYVDGQLVLIFDPTPRKGSLAANVTLFMGAPVNTSIDSYFGGLIDEPAIYNRALSDGEIQAIRQAGAAGRCKVKPSILVQPVSQRVTVGSNVTLTVGATGTPRLRYQWTFSGGASILGATSSAYSFNLENSVTLSVRVTNVFGSVTSSNAVLLANYAPTASGDSVSLDEDTPTNITLISSDPDGDELNYAIVVPPAHGSISGTGSNVLYTPKPNYFGPDSFTFSVSDGLVDSTPGTITINVRCVNDPPIADASATTMLLLSPNNTNATAVLDGTRSSDVEGDPLQFRWFIGASNQPLATGIVAIVVLPLGTNSISLAVSDGMAAGTNTINVEVITTAQAVERLVATINSDVSRSGPLIATLRASIASIDRSNPTAAINQLQAFQNQVLAQLEPLDPEAAQTLIQTAQEVLNTLSNGMPSSSPGGGGQSIRIENLVRQSDGKLRMKFSTPSLKTYVVAASTNMLDWELIGVAVPGGGGTFEFEDRSAPGFTTRFYRIISP